MQLILSRKKREEARLQAQKQKEVQTRMHIKQTLNKMKNQSNKLEDFKKSYIDQAKKSALNGKADL